ncbi:hypothetical protein DDR33_11510 [Pararcticibacter amylolyticus]|uniref:Uncharacterized protein n=1 Tax=Pararcticibacter amylolyticus TaxID=2173175 RepID=A0A2U2PGX4_9SPHI|nr:hypothetical protein DDR33_11510 [Pararcticibacter amylolyticus]
MLAALQGKPYITRLQLSRFTGLSVHGFEHQELKKHMNFRVIFITKGFNHLFNTLNNILQPTNNNNKETVISNVTIKAFSEKLSGAIAS